MNSKFTDYVKEKIRTLDVKYKNVFCNALKARSCERCLTKLFKKEVLDPLGIKSSSPSKRRDCKLGFFGNETSPDDLQVQYDDKSILLECKILTDKSETISGVRNSFGQLLEYLLCSQWQEGCVVIYDERDFKNEEDGSLFNDSICGQLNKWYVNKFTMQNVPCGNVNHDMMISAMRLYSNGNDLNAECYMPPSINSSQSDR